MKYIIMAGGRYDKFKTPKQLLKINGEVIIERTIKLLKENGIKDIAISTNNPAFDYIKDIPKLRHDNEFIYCGKEENKKSKYSWLNAYYPMNEPCCYLHGDVYFSDEAIKKIINTKVEKTMFFCVPDVQDGKRCTQNLKGREPLAYKVNNQTIFRNAINNLLKMIDDGKFENKIAPISWHLYRYLNGLEYITNNWGFMNNIFNSKGDYVVIDDYTSDIDDIKDVEKIEKVIKLGGEKMVKCEIINRNVNIREYERLFNIKRVDNNQPINRFLIGDTFETDEEFAKYLKGESDKSQPLELIKILEVIPEYEKDKEADEIKTKAVKNIKKIEKKQKKDSKLTKKTK